MVASAARSDSTVGLGDNSLPLICLPICRSNVASALMPAPPMPTMCTRCAWLKLTSDTARTSRPPAQRTQPHWRNLDGHMTPPLGYGQARAGDRLAMARLRRTRIVVVDFLIQLACRGRLARDISQQPHRDERGDR